MFAGKHMRQAPFFALLTLPTPAIASGGEALTLLWWELVLLIAVLSSVIFLKLPVRWRIALIAAYSMGLALAIGSVGRLPYLENLLLVNFISIGLPLSAWLATLLIARRSCKHNKSFKGTPNGAP
jgi:hypothetical protein